MLKFGLIALRSQWDPIDILHNSKHGNIINDQKSRPSLLPNKSSRPKDTTYQVLITQIEAKGWLRRKLMKASHWFNIKYAYLQFDETIHYSKDKSYSQPKQNAKWKDGENCVTKENYIQFPKRNMRNGIKTPYVMDIKQWRKFLEKP